MRIYCDLDITLVNSDLRYHKSIEIAAGYGITEQVFNCAVEKIYERYGKLSFTYGRLFNILLEMDPHIPSTLLLDWMMQATAVQLHDDARSFLSRFHPTELVLLTAGVEENQRPKIVSTGIERYFSEILITGSPKCDFISDPPPHSFFVDDAPRELDAMKRKHPSVFCIQVREPGPWEKIRTSELKDLYCPTLKEAGDYILENWPRV